MRNQWGWHWLAVVLVCRVAVAQQSLPAPAAPAIPKFSVDHMDRSVSPRVDFYGFADGTWVRNNPVPPDKSTWEGFNQLHERNVYLIRQLLEEAAGDSTAAATSPRKMVGDFYASAMDTQRIEELGFTPLNADLKRLDQATSIKDLFDVMAGFQLRGVSGILNPNAPPDSKNSSVYALELWQGGLSLPDRDYYLKETFAPQLKAYREHIQRMVILLTNQPGQAATDANVIIELETALAQASRSRVDLRDPLKNYNKMTLPELRTLAPSIPWDSYFAALGLPQSAYVVVGQPEFVQAADKLVASRPLSDWKIYLRWQLLRSNAPNLHKAADDENFAFFGKVLRGQQEQEPRWKRAAAVLDRGLGEALGQIYVDKHFPSQARVRMNELVENLKIVFRDRLRTVD